MYLLYINISGVNMINNRVFEDLYLKDCVKSERDNILKYKNNSVTCPLCENRMELVYEVNEL